MKEMMAWVMTATETAKLMRRVKRIIPRSCSRSVSARVAGSSLAAAAGGDSDADADADADEATAMDVSVFAGAAAAVAGAGVEASFVSQDGVSAIVDVQVCVYVCMGV